MGSKLQLSLEEVKTPAASGCFVFAVTALGQNWEIDRRKSVVAVGAATSMALARLREISNL